MLIMKKIIRSVFLLLLFKTNALSWCTSKITLWTHKHVKPRLESRQCLLRMCHQFTVGMWEGKPVVSLFLQDGWLWLPVIRSAVSSRLLLYNMSEMHARFQLSNCFLCSPVYCPFISLSPFFQLSPPGQWPHLKPNSVTTELPVCLRGDESARHLSY